MASSDNRTPGAWTASRYFVTPDFSAYLLLTQPTGPDASHFFASTDVSIALNRLAAFVDEHSSISRTEKESNEVFLAFAAFISLAMAVPSDPLYSSQWHLNTTFGIDVLPAWNDYTGAGIRVADFDQGVDRFHVDLDGNYSVALSINAHTNTSGGTPIGSGDNHGTATAGLIAAERNGVGVVGVAYGATLISEYSDLSFANIAVDAANAFNYSAANADIQSNSWGFGNLFLNSPNSAFIDNFKTSTYASDAAAVANAGLNGRAGLGTILVQAAGNTRAYGDDTNLHNFQNNRFTITVAATLQDGNVTSYSTPGASILVAAPASPSPGTITTTDRSGNAGYNSGDYTSTFNGTSAATPQVSGVVALMLQANPLLGSRDVQEILAYSAREVGNTASYSFNGAHNWNGGGLHTSTDYGYGLVDATAAVRLAETWTRQQTWNNVVTTIGNFAVNQAIPDNNLTGAAAQFTASGFGILNRVEIDLNVSHTYVGDLVVTLTSPSGLVSTLVNRPGLGALNSFGSSQDNVDFVLDSVQFWGENGDGTWTVRVADRAGGDTGTFNSYGVRFYSAPLTSNDLYIYTNEFATFGTGARATLIDTNGGVDTLNAAAVTAASVINLGPGATSVIAGRSMLIATGTLIENAYGGDGSDNVTGNSAANQLVGGRGDDAIDGGGDTDRAIFSGLRSAYTITDLGGGNVRVSGPDGTDTLSNIERLVFDDQIVTWPLQFAAQTFRLAAFGPALTAGPATTAIRANLPT